MSQEESWIYKFFGGEDDIYGETYGWRLSEEETLEEVEGILRLLEPEPGSRIIDWCGGWGRTGIPLAKRGFRVTLLDFCRKYIKMAEDRAAEEGVEIETICADFRETPSWIQAEYAINIFTSGLGYLEEEDDLKALQSLHAALRPGAKFLVDIINLFWIIRYHREEDFYQSPDGSKCLSLHHHLDPWSNRKYSKLAFQDTSRGIKKWGEEDIHLYSAAELAKLLRQAGFKPLKLYASLQGDWFDLNSQRIVMISERQ